MLSFDRTMVYFQVDMQKGHGSMNNKRLLRKKERYQQGKDKIPQLTSASYERAFEI